MEATNNILDSMSFSIGAEIAFTDEQSDSVIDFPSSSGHQSSRIPPILQQRVKKRKSWVFLPEHGTEYTQGGRIYWRCARCRYSLSSFLIDLSLQPVNHVTDLYAP